LDKSAPLVGGATSRRSTSSLDRLIMRQLPILFAIFAMPAGAAEFRAINIGQPCSTVNAWEVAHGSTPNVTHSDPPLEVYSYNVEEFGRRIIVRYFCHNGKLTSVQSSFPREPWSRAVETYSDVYNSLKSIHGVPSNRDAPLNENSNKPVSANHWNTPISVWEVSGTKLVLMIVPNQPSKPELDDWRVSIGLGRD
jgi:hypothetical protein